MLGSLIGGVFGLVYVEVNSGELPAPTAAVLRIGAAAVFLALVVLLVRSSAAYGGRPREGREGFGPRYWSVVAAEIAAIVLGAAIVRGPLDLPQAVVAWVSVVVGVHFLALAAIWEIRIFCALGCAIGACGAAGIATAAAGSSDAVVATLGGVLPGLLLLGVALVGASGSIRVNDVARNHTQPTRTGRSD